MNHGFAAPCDVSTLQRRTPLDFARLGQGFARQPLFALSSTEECRVSSNRAPMRRRKRRTTPTTTTWL